MSGQNVISDISVIKPASESFHNKCGEVQNSVSPSLAHTSLSPASTQSGGNCMLRRGGRRSHKHARKSHKKHVRKSHKKHARKSHKKHHK